MHRPQFLLTCFQRQEFLPSCKGQHGKWVEALISFLHSLSYPLYWIAGTYCLGRLCCRPSGWPLADQPSMYPPNLSSAQQSKLGFSLDALSPPCPLPSPYVSLRGSSGLTSSRKPTEPALSFELLQLEQSGSLLVPYE